MAQSLEDLEAAMLDAPCMAGLGNAFLYKAAGQAQFVERRGYVDYPEVLRDTQTGQMIDQDISVEVLIADIPAKPGGNDRIQLPKLPGQTFRPVNARKSASGTHWQFEVVLANG